MSTILLYDSYDSFTYNLKDYLEQGGATVVVVKNDAMLLDEMKSLNPDGLVISPGPKRPHESGNLMDVLRYFHDKIPVLGVCLGHQAIGVLFGFELVKSDKPMHGKVSAMSIQHDELFLGMPPAFEVCRYHSLILRQMEHKDISVIAWTDDNQIMAMRHNKFPIWGVQYHPEAILTQFGHELIANWLKVVTLHRQ